MIPSALRPGKGVKNSKKNFTAFGAMAPGAARGYLIATYRGPGRSQTSPHWDQSCLPENPSPDDARSPSLERYPPGNYFLIIFKNMQPFRLLLRIYIVGVILDKLVLICYNIIVVREHGKNRKGGSAQDEQVD
jgi:hypothetical protein